MILATAGMIVALIGLVMWAFHAAPDMYGVVRKKPVQGWIGLALFAIGAVVSFKAEATVAGHKATDAPVVIPEASAMYRRWVEQAATEEWGVDASPARLAAQVHQESSWNPRAHSSVGAEGLTQFMPSTAKWIAQTFPDKLGAFDPWDAQQAALAAAVYDQWLVNRNPGTTPCDSWAFGFSAYNGGELRLHQEQQMAKRHGLDPGTWFGDVSGQRARNLAAWQQNRGYVRRILLVLEPAYIDAGWSGKAVCS